jgi:hypothetical protein
MNVPPGEDQSDVALSASGLETGRTESGNINFLPTAPLPEFDNVVHFRRSLNVSAMSRDWSD